VEAQLEKVIEEGKKWQEGTKGEDGGVIKS
jgi:hypothetical protein